MSRSALWRQEANVKERERNAVETFRAAVEEGRNRPTKGAIQLVGPDDTFNLNPMLLHNISKSPYFLKCCNKLKDWSALVDEIYYEVKHMAPWTAGAAKTPSTAFCLLVRLFTLRCTEKQMSLMLDHVDSPYIRCVGFLYLRYASDPTLLWQWFQPYLYDEEPVEISPGKAEVTVGSYVRSLLTEMDYYGTLLPRLPVAIERDVKVKLLQAEKVEERAKEHAKDKARMEYFQRVGNRIRALYGDEENPIQWYDAVIDRVILKDDETGEKLARPKFWVTFPEYGNSEVISLGEVDMPASSGAIGSASGRTYDEGRTGRPQGAGSRERDWDRGRGDWRRDERAVGKDERGSRFDGRGEDRGYRTMRNEQHPRRDYGRDQWERDRYYTGDSRGGSRFGDDRGRRRSRSRDRDDHHHNVPARPDGSSSAAFPDEQDLMEEVLRREREKVAAKGRAYAARPATFKESLSVKQDGGGRKRMRSRSPEWDRRGQGERRAVTKEEKPSASAPSPAREKTAAERAVIEEKKRKLLARYG